MPKYHHYVLRSDITMNRFVFVDTVTDKALQHVHRVLGDKGTVLSGDKLSYFFREVAGRGTVCALLGEHLGSIEEVKEAFIENSEMVDSTIQYTVMGLPKFLTAWLIHNKRQSLENSCRKYFTEEIEREWEGEAIEGIRRR